MKPTVGRIILYFGPLLNTHPDHVKVAGAAAIVTEVAATVRVQTPLGETPAIGVNVQMPPGSSPAVRGCWLPDEEGRTAPDGSYWRWPPRS